MKQKEVDAIVLEIFNICRKKRIGFEYRSIKVKHVNLDKIMVTDFDSNNKIIFNIEAYIGVDNSLFGYTGNNTVTIQDALEQVKQYKK